MIFLLSLWIGEEFPVMSLSEKAEKVSKNEEVMSGIDPPAARPLPA
jgi:hypothetical protein